MTGRGFLKLLSVAIILETAASVYADPTSTVAGVSIFSNYIPGPQNEKGTLVLGSVLEAYEEPVYIPIFVETFDNYISGPLAGQGTWIWNPSAWGGEFSPNVSPGRDKHLAGDATKRGGTAASCFFPDIFTNGNTAGRIEFDFRRGVNELDFLVGPAVIVNGTAENVFAEAIGGQFAGYGGGCFTPKYRGGYNNPLIIYRLWQPGTAYHLVMDLVKTGDVVTAATSIDGIPIWNLSGIAFSNTAPQGINSLMIRGGDHIAPEYGVDNIKVSVPLKMKGTSLFQH